MKNRLSAWRPLLITAAFALAAVGLFILRPASGGMGQLPEQPQDKRNLVLSVPTDAVQMMRVLLDVFEMENPDISVSISSLSDSAEYRYNRYKADFYSKENTADVVCIELTWLPEFAAQGWILPLENFYAPGFSEDFISTAADACQYKGTLYAVPATVDVPVLYYRSDLLAQPPRNYEEMISLSREQAGVHGLKYGYACPGQASEDLLCTAYEFIWAQGGEMVRNGLVAVNSAEVQAGLQQCIDAIYSNSDPTDLFSFTEEDARIAFEAGDALFLRSGQVAYQKLNSPQSAVAGKFATCPLPEAVPGIYPAGTLGGQQYAISRSSRYPNEAARLLSYLVSEKVQRRQCEDSGIPPTLLSCYEVPELISHFTDRPAPLETYKKARLRPVTPYYMEISKQIVPEFSRVARLAISPQTAAENLENILKDYFVLP